MQRIERNIPNGAEKVTRRRGVTLPALSFIVALLAMGTIAACDQSSIFYDISNETKPKDPIIEGSPSRMVMFPSGSSTMWVSNGTLHSFNGSSWSKEKDPDGTVRSLAVAGGFMYALTIDGGSDTTTRIWRTADGSSWTRLSLAAVVSTYSFLDSIYTAGPVGAETVFVGAHVPAGQEDPVTAYGVLYVNGTKLEPVGNMIGLNPKDAAGALAGAAYAGAKYYLATTMTGIYVSADNDPTSGYGAAVSGTAGNGYLLSGLTAIGSTIVGVGRGESILYGDSTGFSAKSFSDMMFIGAMATWDQTGDGTPDLLLVAIDDNDNIYTYGYREIVLSEGAFPSSPSLKIPGNGSLTTVKDEDQYDSSLGQQAVGALFHYDSGGKQVLFASTFSKGLWSYRDEEWNAEE